MSRRGRLILLLVWLLAAAAISYFLLREGRFATGSNDPGTSVAAKPKQMMPNADKVAQLPSQASSTTPLPHPASVQVQWKLDLEKVIAPPSNPWVALALVDRDVEPEELCPELGEDSDGAEATARGNVDKLDDDEKERGCILPVGEQMPPTTSNASMPFEHRPAIDVITRSPLSRGLVVGGPIGAALGAIALSNDSFERESISPN